MDVLLGKLCQEGKAAQISPPRTSYILSLSKDVDRTEDTKLFVCNIIHQPSSCRDQVQKCPTEAPASIPSHSVSNNSQNNGHGKVYTCNRQTQGTFRLQEVPIVSLGTEIITANEIWIKREEGKQLEWPTVDTLQILKFPQGHCKVGHLLASIARRRLGSRIP